MHRLKHLVPVSLAAALAWPVPASSQEARLSPAEWREVQLMRLTGPLSGDYLRPQMSLRWAITSTLDGPPEPDASLAQGWRLESGCRRHSCDEKAALLWDATGKLRAAALIHFSCSAPGLLPPGERPCDVEPTLTIVSRPDDRAANRRSLLDWAATHIEVGRVEYLQAP